MPNSATNLLDLSQLSLPQRREIKDFFSFCSPGKQLAKYLKYPTVSVICAAH